jgi:hypothetical protein
VGREKTTQAPWFPPAGPFKEKSFCETSFEWDLFRTLYHLILYMVPNGRVKYYRKIHFALQYCNVDEKQKGELISVLSG